MTDAEEREAPTRVEIDRLTTEILRRWRQQLRRSAEDRPRSGERGENERLLVSALLRVSESDDEQLLPALAAAAACYGASQRRDKLDPGGLCDELASLRQIVWNQLKEIDPGMRNAVDRILRFDQALSIVTKAAVAAGYAGELRDTAECVQPPTPPDDRHAS